MAHSSSPKVQTAATQEPEQTVAARPARVDCWTMEGESLSYQNLLFRRVPINSILGFIIGAYKKVGYGSFRIFRQVWVHQDSGPRAP